ncbi:MAG: M28 family peptidase [Acidobacteria bacterium]|nr:M28 family peptidase [Acidobacteriota bacterium]
MTLRHACALLLLVCSLLSSSFARPAQNSSAASRLVGEVFTGGQQLKYLSLLSDEIGSRLTGTRAARRAEEAMEDEFKRLGLANVRREPFTMPSAWERGTASAALVSHGGRALHVASYTWTPGTDTPFEAEIVDVGEGRPEDLRREAARLKGNVALVVPTGADLAALIEKFYRTPILVRELKEAGARAVLYASDKQHSMLYTSPVDFTASSRLAALPTVSLAGEDVSLLRRLLGQQQRPRVRLDVRNKTGPAFESTNVVGEIRGRERPEEIVLVGAHLDSNDLGPGALDNAARQRALHGRGRAQPHHASGRVGLPARPPHRRRYGGQGRAARLRGGGGDSGRDRLRPRRQRAPLRAQAQRGGSQKDGRRDKS